MNKFEKLIVETINHYLTCGPLRPKDREFHGNSGYIRIEFVTRQSVMYKVILWLNEELELRTTIWEKPAAADEDEYGFEQYEGTIKNLTEEEYFQRSTVELFLHSYEFLQYIKTVLAGDNYVGKFIENNA